MKRENETRRRSGFTLVELLVVVAIIALLVSILLPTLSRAKELTKRAICATNLSGLGKSVHIYANDFDDAIPSFCDFGDNDRVDHVGLQYSVKDLAGKTFGNSRGWFIMVKKGYCSLGIFRCPSDGQVDRGDYGISDVYDFKPRSGLSPLSYSLQATKRWNDGSDGLLITTTDKANLAIAADGNGLTKWHGMTDTYAQVVRDTSIEADENNPGKMNSPNHSRDGQNVLVLGSSVSWEKTPLCGIDDDNIFTVSDGTALGRAGGNDLKKAPPQDEEDSFLVP